METYSIWHRPPNNYIRVYFKFFFVSLSLSSKKQIGASYILSMRYPQHFDWCKGLELLSYTNSCFVQQLYSSDLTLHAHMNTPSLNILRIQAAPQGYLSIPDTGVTFITFLTHQVFSISGIFVSFTFIWGHYLYNSCLLLYFPILGAELITASFKHDLIDKWPSASQNFDPGT